MHFDINARTIYRVRHGSFAYGTNVEGSDEDFKGVCIKPKECYLGFTRTFEQHEHMGSKSDGIDEVIYSLDKFAKLAADCNPNIIEVLFVDDSDIINIDEFGEELRSFRDEFLSKKAKFTFSGYSHAQLKRIKTHRSWLLDPPKTVPTREQFGISGQVPNKSELGAFDSLLNVPSVDDRTIEDAQVEIAHTAQQTLGLNLSKDVVTLFVREKAYQAAKTHYEQYLSWLKNRNPARAELEAKFGLDTKHAMHLCRLMRMCKEILATGKVNVKRVEDRDELLAIRGGAWSYDQIITHAEALEAECENLYKTSSLRKEPDRVALDNFVIDMTERYLRLHG